MAFMNNTRIDPESGEQASLVPSWGDDFELRTYFQGIDPYEYALANPREYTLAVQLLDVVKVHAVTWVGLYRGTLKALPKFPDVLEKVVCCQRAGMQLGLPAYWD